MVEIGSQLARRRAAVAEQWELDGASVVLGAGDPVPIPGRADLTYPFRAHSEYFYLTDRQRPGGVLAFDPDEGWRDFVVAVSRDELLWGGSPAEAEGGEPIGELAGWLAGRRDRPIASLGAPVDGVGDAPALEQELRRRLNVIRRPKDEVELDRMRRAERATRAGFAVARELLEPGRSERDIQIELEAEFLRRGSDAPAYDTIIGSGPNSAVLHYSPSARRLAEGELVLIDAGGEYRCYASDVTRTYPVGGTLTSEQERLHSLVHAAVDAATERCVTGTEWADVHRTAARRIGEGLIELGILKGNVDDLLERGTVTLFFPHGVGHMVGLGVRDAGEVLPGRRPQPGMPRLRMDLPLAPGYVVTVEPGVYFVPALLNDRAARASHRDAVDWDRVDRLLGVGGIRIEHNVLVTEDRPDNLTADIPV